jgi:hypothetical protein
MTVKKFVLCICVLLFSISLFSAVSGVAAAEFVSGDTVSATKNYENAYIVGGNVTQKGQVDKDLLGAGGTISTEGFVNRNVLVTGGTVTIKSQIGASLFAAGGTVVIDTPQTVGSVRVAGGNVTLSGKYGEDVLVTGGDVVIRDATIAGDVYVGAGTLTVVNSSIQGKLQGQYGELKGNDLKTQVVGTVDLKKVETDNDQKERRKSMILDYFNISWELSVLVVTLIIAWLLGSRNRLSIPSIKWGKTFGLDLLLGLGVIILPGIISVILLVLQLFPLALLLPAIVFLKIIAAMLVLPIYVGNWIKNTFKWTFATKWAVVIGYLVLLGFSLLSKVDYLGVLGLIIAVFALAHIGFLLRTGFSAVNHYLVTRPVKDTKKST